MEKRKFLKGSRGITLIALIITIIILIILAGVSISLIGGEDGIIAKAQEAKEKTEVAIQNEQEKINELLNQLNGGNNPEDNITKVAIPTLSDSNKEYTGAEQTPTISGYNSEYVTQTGDATATIPGTYTIKWNLKDTTNSKWSDGTTEEKSATWTICNPTLASQITAANYGDSVAYSVTVNGVTLNNWKIFYKDETTNEVIMVYNDYLPNSTGIAAGAGLNTYGDYGLYKGNNREEWIVKLNDSSIWAKLIRGDLAGKATAKGAVDLETWVASWNAKGYAPIYMGTNTQGYTIGSSENPTTYYRNVSDDAGYNNTLYFPHKEVVSNCKGYWISSPAGNGGKSMMIVNYDGIVQTKDYQITVYGVCPAVYLTSDILTSGKDASGAWVIE